MNFTFETGNCFSTAVANRFFESKLVWYISEGRNEYRSLVRKPEKQTKCKTFAE